MEDTLKWMFANFLDMNLVHTDSRYLGLPVTVGQCRTETFKELEQKVGKKLQDWKHLTLSWAGREILIKSCLQSLPVFAMSCFKIPISLSQRMTAHMVKFWWNGGKKDKGIHWLRREQLLKEKCQGGMGFRYMDCFNDAMLMKQLWRIFSEPDSLLAVILRHKYLRHGFGISRRTNQGHSFVWKSISKTIEMFLTGLINEEGRWIWKLSSSGSYTVKSGYGLAYRWKMAREQSGGEASDWKKRERIWSSLWRVKLPEGLKILTWRFFHNALPTSSNLVRRGVDIPKGCMLCGVKNESVEHLCMDCWWSKSFWDSMGVNVTSGEFTGDPTGWLWSCLEKGNATTIKNIILGIYWIWKNRNRVAHGGQWWTSSYCRHKAMSLDTQWALKKLAGGYDSQFGDADLGRGWVVWCDGAWIASRRKGGWAAIIVLNGVVMRCVADFTVSGVFGLQTEVNGIIAGLHLAESFKCVSVTILSDCVEAIKAVQGIRGGENLLAASLEEGSKILLEHPNWVVRHVFREVNGEADFLARKACREGWKWDSHRAIPLLSEGFGIRGQWRGNPGCISS